VKTDTKTGAMERLIVKVALGATGKELEDAVVAGHREVCSTGREAGRSVTEKVDLGTDHPKQRGALLCGIAESVGVEAEYEGVGKNARRGIVTLKGPRAEVDWARAVYAVLFKDAAVRSGARREAGTTRQTALTLAVEELSDRLVPKLRKAGRQAEPAAA
jgi:hypothetical protein